MDMIYVFQTNFKKLHFRRFQKELVLLLRGTHWNFDFEDNQNILRVQSSESIEVQKIMDFFTFNKFDCIELQD